MQEPHVGFGAELLHLFCFWESRGAVLTKRTVIDVDLQIKSISRIKILIVLGTVIKDVGWKTVYP